MNKDLDEIEQILKIQLHLQLRQLEFNMDARIDNELQKLRGQKSVAFTTLVEKLRNILNSTEMTNNEKVWEFKEILDAI